jgi:hypothetical protein
MCRFSYINSRLHDLLRKRDVVAAESTPPCMSLVTVVAEKELLTQSCAEGCWVILGIEKYLEAISAVNLLSLAEVRLIKISICS